MGCHQSILEIIVLGWKELSFFFPSLLFRKLISLFQTRVFFPGDRNNKERGVAPQLLGPIFGEGERSTRVQGGGGAGELEFLFGLVFSGRRLELLFIFKNNLLVGLIRIACTHGF